ncbi:MAG: type II toxin-antitoxin system Phd/YefM family antitoxin [Firmicutes bacterium]|nr:type II toxin-antitoxin system Phd/YefM family antitoxin [Bacillota bacterium]
MTAVNMTTLRNNLKKYCDKAYQEKEEVIITRNNEENLIIVRLDEWDRMMKYKAYVEYLAKIDRADKQIQEGSILVKSFEELEAMAE